MKNDKFEDEI